MATPPAPILRPAVRGDIAAVTAIYAREVATGTASFELTPPDVAEMVARWEAVTAAGHPYLVATRAGAVAGYAYCGPWRTRPAYAATVECSVYVHPDHRRAGVGAALLGALIEASAKAGRRQMIAVIGDSANAGSIGLHRAMGFRPVGTLTSVGRKFDRWVDSVLMQRALGPPDA